jgi:prephenate dehydrogenase
VDIAVIGMGLIGGSLLQALAAAGHTVWGYDADPATRANARTAAAQAPPHARWRVVGEVGDAVIPADLAVIAVPFPAVDEVLHALVSAGYAGLVTDVTSVKAPVRELVAHRLHGGHSRLAGFVGGHPMAGRETSGFASADPSLFVGCPWVLCLEPDTALTDWLVLADLFTRLGARVVPITGQEHDRAVATVSAVPHRGGARQGAPHRRRPARTHARRRLLPGRHPGGGRPAGADRGDVRRERARGAAGAGGGDRGARRRRRRAAVGPPDPGPAFLAGAAGRDPHRLAAAAGTADRPAGDPGGAAAPGPCRRLGHRGRGRPPYGHRGPPGRWRRPRR